MIYLVKKGSIQKVKYKDTVLKTNEIHNQYGGSNEGSPQIFLKINDGI